ncbi:uncharacterized protein K02A2.6-like [Rhipicephalus sanguineus]|uniref:uncharacterized protein K02A2.6-like n=1 Tax=Rhipicephalus sanguineus TaxID=34632 RepID=UPI0020C3A4A8|nr:uncharacterized protein K02A2.6-like [Rhipicephalus sanguineus]XP_049272637.1 uncharacterized protein K02A2.6-like [Rhipicephalus sanguineus]
MPVSSHDIERTARDPLLCKVMDFVSAGWPSCVAEKDLKPFFDRRYELTVHQGCIMFGMRVIVPAKLRNLLLDELHEGHPGIVSSKQLARSYVWWPSIEADLEHRVKACGQFHLASSQVPAAQADHRSTPRGIRPGGIRVPGVSAQRRPNDILRSYHEWS